MLQNVKSNFMNFDFNSSQYNYIDIHTHSSQHIDGVFSLQSFFIEDSQKKTKQHFSAGIHPWNIVNNNSAKLMTLSSVLQNNKLLAIGEIGLDKMNNYENYTKQIKVFTEQLKIADNVKKPVIIHCVKAFSDIQKILKELQPKIPLIFHGFNENIQIAKQLLKYNSYFSFGEYLFRSNYKAKKVFTQIPSNRIFLETDESDLSIQNIYKKAAELRKIDIQKLQKHISENFLTVF